MLIAFFHISFEISNANIMTPAEIQNDIIAKLNDITARLGTDSITL